jgi:peptidoglycan/LPS O-acetylase OafA/YrhL
MTMQDKRAIPSLDGLRAFSVLAVILGHTRDASLDHFRLLKAFRNGGQGVAVFFVLSGFLITHLLLKEKGRTGTLNLKEFYFRRTMRIFPPFYVFVLVVGILTFFHLASVDSRSFLAALTYTWNYVPQANDSWVLGHCWSLSLEEQFYLLWPLCIARLKRETCLKITLGIILLSPVSRIVTYYAWPSMRTHINMMLHTHVDAIMTGCLLTLLIDMDLWKTARSITLRPWAPALALFFLFAIATPAELRWRGTYQMSVGISLENIAIATLVLFAVFRHHSYLGQLLNWRPIRHIGMISYSLYLWQQLFTGPRTHNLAQSLIFSFLCAEASYFLVEKPSFRLRDMIQKRLFKPRPAIAVQPTPQLQ